MGSSSHPTTTNTYQSQRLQHTIYLTDLRLVDIDRYRKAVQSVRSSTARYRSNVGTGVRKWLYASVCALLTLEVAGVGDDDCAGLLEEVERGCHFVDDSGWM